MSESPTTSTYPGVIDSWNFLTDKEDLAEVSDINKIKDAILETQTELGAAPSGSLASVTARLAMIQNVDGAVQKGTAFPSTGLVDGQLFYRTDLDTVYIYDGSTWDLLSTPAMTVSSVTAISSANSGDITIAANKIYKVIVSITNTSADETIGLRFESDTTSGHYLDKNVDATYITISEIDVGVASKKYSFSEFMIDTTATGNSLAKVFGSGVSSTTAGAQVNHAIWGSFVPGSGSVTNFEILATGANTLTGNIYVYEMGLIA